MGFFLLGKRRDDAALQLISDTLYATRQDAIDALALIDVPAELDSEVFAVDLESATPVVVVQKKQEAPKAELPMSMTAEPEPEAGPEPEPAPESATDEENLPDAPESEEDGLHDALKGAAATLEDEGIVAPDSVGPAVGEAAQDQSWPWASGEESAEESASSDEGDTDLDEAVAQAGPAEEYVPDPLEEPAVSVGEMLPTTTPVEDVDASQAVIMGSYRDDAPVAEETPAPEPPPVAEEPVVPEDEPTAEDVQTPDSPAEESPYITNELPAEPAFDGAADSLPNEKARNDLETVLADLEIPGAGTPDPTPPTPETDSADLLAESGLAEAPEADSGFEAGGSDLDQLTCDDCVYMNTCPKRGDSDPSTCGSFQWKSN